MEDTALNSLLGDQKFSPHYNLMLGECFWRNIEVYGMKFSYEMFEAVEFVIDKWCEATLKPHLSKRIRLFYRVTFEYLSEYALIYCWVRVNVAGTSNPLIGEASEKYPIRSLKKALEKISSNFPQNVEKLRHLKSLPSSLVLKEASI